MFLHMVSRMETVILVQILKSPKTSHLFSQLDVPVSLLTSTSTSQHSEWRITTGKKSSDERHAVLKPPRVSTFNLLSLA